MAIVYAPNWFGSSITNETQRNWVGGANSAATVLRMQENGFWITDMSGRSKEFIVDYWGSDNQGWQTFADFVNSVGGAAGKAFRINVRGIIAGPENSDVFWFHPDWAGCEYMHLVIHPGAWISGRGGNGASGSGSDDANHGYRHGYNCINNSIGGKLRIENHGIIAGGGGGGGDSCSGNKRETIMGGGGGQPFGRGGISIYHANNWENGHDATRDAPGPQTRYNSLGLGGPGGYGGAGGALGQGGQQGGRFMSDRDFLATPGNPGWAVHGQAPTWINRGDIRGYSV